MKRGVIKLLGVMLLASALLPSAALADPLRDALARAYVGNPTLRAARAGQRAVDEQVPQALSGWRPTVSAQSSLSKSASASWYVSQPSGDPSTTSGSTGANYQLQIKLDQPLFRGFGTVEGTAVAEANVKSGQQNLLATEQQVLFNAAQAYMNVYLYRELVALQIKNVRALNGQLSASNERFKVGEITKTDVAQARASLSQAKGILESYKAQLGASEATYLQIVGNPAGATPYPPAPHLPASLEEAFRIAGELNPQILAQAFAEDAAQHNVGLKTAPLLPQLDLVATANQSSSIDNWGTGNIWRRSLQRNGDSHNLSASAALVGTIPLYDGGYNYALVRAAKQYASQQRINVIVVARQVRQVVTQAWSLLNGARSKTAYDGDQISAAQLALDGVQQEFQAGTRTTYDVLQAQQALVNAQISAVQDRYNAVIYAYQLLSGIGKLTAADQHLNVPIYDPNENYRRVRNKWIGLGAKTVN